MTMTSHKQPKVPEQDLRSVDEMADKLDSLMLILFEYVDQSLSDARRSRTTVAEASELYGILSSVFESAILVTHKSKFVQFLILHICGVDAQLSLAQTTMDNCPDPVGRGEDTMLLYREFASSLINVIIDPYRATATRQSGACYLASFISRASFVCVETVCETVDALLRWAEAYIQSLGSLISSSVHAPDAREQCSLHPLFYTVCQAAYYIMCFRGSEVVRFLRSPPEPEQRLFLSHIDLSAARWTRICTHALFPLRYCLESVRTEFLRISKFLTLIDDAVRERLVSDEELKRTFDVHSPILKRKRRVASRITTAATLEKERVNGGVGGLGRGHNPLDSFFPFDPYLLRQSYRYIEPLYKHWDCGAVESEVSNENDVDMEALDDNGEDTINVVDSDSDDDSHQHSVLADTDSDSDSDSDEDGQLETAQSRKRFMSIGGSTVTSVSSRPSSLGDKSVGGPTTDIATRRGDLKQAWSHATKRARAPSVENGSW
jgi:RNA polymerase I-specific transcription initiation factor RRN3